MKNLSFQAFLLMSLFMSILVLPNSAQAYLDPGTGSYITQLMIGAVVGGGYAFKLYWRQIMETLKKFFDRDKADEKEV